MSLEDKCLRLLTESNKPYNVQGVSDMLASQGVKKTQVDKTLAALAAAGKIVVKEFGKSKLYYPAQEGLPQLAPDEKAAKMAEIKELGDQVKAQDEAVAALKLELASSNSTLTAEQLRERVAALQVESEALDGKLASLRGGAVLISTADVEAAEKTFTAMMGAWTRRRRIFLNIWDAVSENMDGKQSDLFEEMGVETDEAVGETPSRYQILLPKNKRARV